MIPLIKRIEKKEKEKGHRPKLHLCPLGIPVRPRPSAGACAPSGIGFRALCVALVIRHIHPVEEPGVRLRVFAQTDTQTCNYNTRVVVVEASHRLWLADCAAFQRTQHSNVTCSWSHIPIQKHYIIKKKKKKDKTQNPSGRRNGLQTLRLYLSDCYHRCQLKR